MMETTTIIRANNELKLTPVGNVSGFIWNEDDRFSCFVLKFYKCWSADSVPENIFLIEKQRAPSEQE